MAERDVHLRQGLALGTASLEFVKRGRGLHRREVGGWDAAADLLDTRREQCGGGGIRTHEGLSGPNGFQDRLHQPLGHPSESKAGACLLSLLDDSKRGGGRQA